jgi:hypothetical protein
MRFRIAPEHLGSTFVTKRQWRKTQHENYEENDGKQGENSSTTERVKVHRAAQLLKSAICHWVSR